MGLIATQVPENVQDYITKNAGIVLNEFDPEAGTVKRSAIKGATTGGIQFTDKPTYTDNGEDVDNMPKGTMEMMEEDSREVTASGTFVSASAHTIKDLAGTADLNSEGDQITPRNELKVSDFQEHIWLLFDYGVGGWIAIRMDNVLNEDGLSIKSTDKLKAQFAFNFKAHYSISSPETVPYEIFIKNGTSSSSSSAETPHSDATTTS